LTVNDNGLQTSVTNRELEHSFQVYSSKLALFKSSGQNAQFPSSVYPYETTLLAVILNVASISTVLSGTMTTQIQNKLRAGFPNSGYNSRNVNYKTRHIHISQVSNDTK
jgi:hypothetical protein